MDTDAHGFFNRQLNAGDEPLITGKLPWLSFGAYTAFPTIIARRLPIIVDCYDAERV